jgi:acetylornithine deacetylase/succinyl-diaminopimelate desuccinylase-like protein
MADHLTGQTVELLQTLIRNACVNDGLANSGHEFRSADTLETFLEGTGLTIERFEPTPGRVSLVCRIEGTNPNAPSLCLMGHTDVVPVNPDGWTRDPFGGELITSPHGIDEVWGRGAVDMLNLTASMAVAFRHLARSRFRPRGDLIYFAVADEESGSAHGARWMAEHHPDVIRADYVLTENGGLHSGGEGSGRSGGSDRPGHHTVSVTVGEKGVAWRKLRIRGIPGHGSMPFRKDNALVQAAAVIQRISDYNPPARFHELWLERVDTLGLSPEQAAVMLDPVKLDETLRAMPDAGTASYLYSCVHTTFSCNVLDTGKEAKTNVIPDNVELNVDIRTLPGETPAEVETHLRAALGDLADKVDVEIIMNDMSTMSRLDTPLWESLQRAVNHPFGSARLSPTLSVGFTDARVFRDLGSVAYGAGLMSPDLDSGEFSRRFHGNDERVDVESLRLSTQLWIDTATDLLS